MKRLPKLEELDRLAQNNGKGFTRAVLEVWGVPWPPKSGWLKALRQEILSGAGDKIIREDKKAPRRPNGKKDREARRLARQQQSKTYAPTPNAPRSLKSFYASWEWRTLRLEVLKAQGHRCQACGAAPGDKTVSGAPVRIVVDHIKPISKFWELRLEVTNLQVLCDECNMGKGAWDQTDYRPGIVLWGETWPDDNKQVN
jgi:5-methylcytosine-specific restriction endonuclease McrA